MDFERDFKGVWIPKEIWLTDELTMLEKVIYTEIDSLDNENTHCIAGNEYFASFCNCSESKVSKAIKKLQDMGLIEIIAFNGRRRTIAVLGRVAKNARQTSKKCEAESQKMPAINIYNNIPNNNTLTNVNVCSARKRFTPPKLEDVKAYCEERHNNVDPERFMDYYTANGWVQGKGKPVKDWKACVRTWERNGFDKGKAKTIEDIREKQMMEDLQIVNFNTGG